MCKILCKIHAKYAQLSAQHNYRNVSKSEQNCAVAVGQTNDVKRLIFLGIDYFLVFSISFRMFAHISSLALALTLSLSLCASLNFKKDFGM